MAFGTPQAALDSGTQGGQGVDPNNDPYQLQEAGQMYGQMQQQQDAQGPQPGPEQQDPTTSEPTEKLRALIESVNIAEHLDEDKLNEIANDCATGFENDLASRKDWELKIDEWTRLAQQVQEQKAYPWPKASNVKYPLLSTSAMQFAARAYPTLVPSDGKVVMGQVIGKDPDDSKSEQAERIGTYMSWDIMHNMDRWEEDMDKLLIMLPVTGIMFKKTYWNPTTKKNCSHLVLPKNLVVDYWTKNLCDSERISEIIPMSERQVKERQMSKIFLKDVDLGQAPSTTSMMAGAYGDRNNGYWAPSNDFTTPFEIIEQHTYIDLDDDGYREPYIVTFHRASKKVLRITARYDEKTMLHNDDGTLAGIKPIEYYTKFGFIPSPDGSFYDIGFGMLLGPLNESVNTLINQLIDSGTLNNLQSGFIGKGLRIRMGDQRFQPGEWKAVNAVGDDLKKQIFPLPTKEPSAVLMQLMTALITSGKELASIAEIFTGKMPGQNTPATTTMATVEQGMKVFTAIYKRLYRALAEEFCKLFDLNSTYLDHNTYSSVVNEPIGPNDFDNDLYRVIPAADPNAVSSSEKLQKAQGLLQMLPLGTLDPVEVTKRNLIAQEQPEWQKLLNQAIQQTGQMPSPPPDPKAQELQMKMQADQQQAQLKTAQGQQKMELDSRTAQTKLAMAAQEHQQDMQFKAQEAQVAAAAQMHKDNAQVQGELMKNHASQQMAKQDLQHNQEQHQAGMAQQHEQHKAKVQQTKETSKLAQAKHSATGSRKK